MSLTVKFFGAVDPKQEVPDGIYCLLRTKGTKAWKYTQIEVRDGIVIVTKQVDLQNDVKSFRRHLLTLIEEDRIIWMPQRDLGEFNIMIAMSIPTNELEPNFDHLDKIVELPSSLLD